MIVLYGLMLFIGLGYYIFKVRFDLHMFQQNSYRPERYFRWMNQTHQPLVRKSDWMFLIGFAISSFPSLTGNPVVTWIGFVLGLPFMALSLLMFHVKITWQPAKKKLTWTPRVKRMFITAFIWLNILYAFAFISHNLWFIWVSVVFSVVYSWAFILIANMTNTPIEQGINHYYYKDAQKRLMQNPNLIIIGVTGSYGKTSVKNLLYQLLSQKYNVLMTPESYNTLLGVIRTIRERLNPTHDIFIVEMGAKQEGDIAEICKLVNPHMGLITSIGPQHLESFKTIENVIKTKGELFRNTHPEGTIFVNLNDDNLRNMDLPKGTKAVLFGNNTQKKAQYGVSDIQVSDEGTTFTIFNKNDKKKASFKTRLLGAHNVDNLLGSIAIAMELGVSEAQINRGLYDMYPVEHRLSCKKSPYGYTIIDDAFNSNPVGSKNALEVLKHMKGNKKIILTPGMIELGEQQYELNEKFGEYMADACDYVVLVGKKQTEPIQQGLKNKKFPSEKWVVVQNLAEGFKAVNDFAKPGDVLLIENDLPDSFNE